MSTTIFNQEIKRLISQKNPVLEYVNEKFKKSHQNKNYYGFFDDFLFKYGILTLGYSPTLKGNKYVPYINCSRNNMFRMEKGITDLSNKAHSLTECQKVIASYLIEQLKYLNVLNFENWNPEFNQEAAI